MTAAKHVATVAVMEPADAGARGLTLSQALEVRDLPAEGLRYVETVAESRVEALLGEAVRNGPVRFTVAEQGHATVEVQPMSPEEPPPVRVRGRIRAGLGTICVRCLEEVLVNLDVPFESTLFPDPPSKEPSSDSPTGRKTKLRPVLDDEGKLEAWNDTFPDPDKLDEGSYDGLRVPLPELLSQALLIELPTDPACPESSECDARTAELIDAANAEARASDAEGDPRWAALRALRARSDPEPEGNR